MQLLAIQNYGEMAIHLNTYLEGNCDIFMGTILIVIRFNTYLRGKDNYLNCGFYEEMAIHFNPIEGAITIAFNTDLWGDSHYFKTYGDYFQYSFVGRWSFISTPIQKEMAILHRSGL